MTDHRIPRAERSRMKATLSRRRFFESTAAFTPLALVDGDSFLARGSGGTAPGLPGQSKSGSAVLRSLRELAARTELFDTHEHIWHEDRRLKEGTDVFLLFSHYTSDDLVSAGMSRRAVANLQDHEIPLEKRWKDLAPYWPYTRSTGYGRCILIAAQDLFGVEDINDQTYQRLSERITAANRPGWYETVLKKKARISISLLDDVTTMRGEPLHYDKRFFRIVTRFDYIIMAVREEDLRYIEGVTGVAIHDLADFEKALAVAVEKAVRQGLAAIKTVLAYLRTLQVDKVERADAERAFDKVFTSSESTAADPAARKQLQDYMVHKLVQQAAEHHLPVQIHTGMQAGNINHIAWADPSHLSDLLNEYQQVRFDLFHGGFPYHGEFATLAKNLPNVYPDLCWLHIIAPGVAKRTLHELIETVPANKILGFGGDFFHVEGAYAHAQMARAVTAEVLAEKVEQGYLKEAEAASLLVRILYRNGKELFG